MRRAADLLTVGFGAMAVFQLVLAAGAPLGHAAWGGSHAHLTNGQRVGSAISVVFYLFAIAIVRRRAAGTTQPFYRWAMWVLTVIMALAALANVASGSNWENFLLAPIAFILFVLCAVVARSGPRSHPTRTATAAAAS